jgi:site-specific DNA-methyltransferase (adenine-specific)
MFGAIDSPVIRPPDHGGASRFFYVAKVDKWERDFGCELLPLRAPADTVDRKPDSAGIGNARAGAGRSGEGVRNHHPTLKPIELTTRYARLILPPPRPSPRRLLNIFSGSGSEAIGAIRAGWDEIVCVEMDPEYVEIARHRVRRWQSLPAHMTVAHIKATAIPDNPAQVTIEDVLGRLA